MRLWSRIGALVLAAASIVQAAKLEYRAGETSVVVEVFIQNTSGSPLTGLTYNAPGLTCYYKRNNGSGTVNASINNIITLGVYAGSATNAALKEVDAVHMPGLYELHLPNNALAAPARSVVFFLSGAANMAPLPMEIALYDPNGIDANVIAINGGPTNAPNATLYLRSLHIVADEGDDAIHAEVENGSPGHALYLRGGTQANSAAVYAKGINNPAIQIEGQATGYANTVDIRGPSSGSGAAVAIGGGAGAGSLYIEAGSGDAVTLLNDDGSGYGLHIQQNGGAPAGVRIENYQGPALQIKTGDGGGGYVNPGAIDADLTLASIWTNAKAAFLDALVSSRAPASTALDNTVWTGARAAKVDNLDATISSRAPASTALSNATWTNARAANLDRLDANVSTRLAAASYTTPPTAAQNADAVWQMSVASASGTNDSVGQRLIQVADMIGPGGLDDLIVNMNDAVTSYLDVAISTRAPASTALSTANWTNARAGKLDFLDALVSSRLPTSAYIPAPTTADIWNELLAGYLTPGSAGKALADAAAGGSSVICGDATQVKQDQILAKLSNVSVVVVNPVASNGSISIIQGNDYTGAAALVLSRSWSGLDLTGATATFSAIPLPDYEQGGRPATFGPIPCGFTYSGGTATATVSLSAADTAAMRSVPPARSFNYRYEIRVTTTGGLKQTLFLGQMNVTQQVPK